MKGGFSDRDFELAVATSIYTVKDLVEPYKPDPRYLIASS